ncbi:MAG: hypothetical protein PHE07_01410 [Bacteroidales bacterium]|nr:hypothetical protein [Bacteroidales bacterium]
MFFLPTYSINLFSDQDHSMVSSVANGLLKSAPESNEDLIKQSLETLTLFSFADKENSKQIGQELIDLMFDLIRKHRYDFDTTTLLHFKEEIIDLTYDWIRRNKLRKSLKHYPEIFESCFVFCIYNYAEVVRRERA